MRCALLVAVLTLGSLLGSAASAQSSDGKLPNSCVAVQNASAEPCRLVPRKAIIGNAAIDPFDVKGNTFAQSLSAVQAVKARQSFLKLKATINAKQVESLLGDTSQETQINRPSQVKSQASSSITTTSGESINTLDAYVVINDIERRLNKIGYSLKTDKLPVIPMDQLYPESPSTKPSVANSPVATSSPSPMVSTPPQAAVSVSPIPNASTTCVPRPTSTSDPDFDKAWEQIQAVARAGSSGKNLINRCDWDFEPELSVAESLPPVVPTSISVAQLDPTFGNLDMGPASIALTTGFNPKWDGKAATLTLSETLNGTFLKQNISLANFTGMLTAPTTGDSTADLKLAVANVTAYETKQTFKLLLYDVTPASDFALFDKVDQKFSFGPYAFDFTLSGRGHVGAAVSAQAGPSGYYVHVAPDVSATVSGGPKLAAFVVDGGINVSVDIVRLSGDGGVIAGIFNDVTNSNKPTVLVLRSFGSYTLSAGSGNVYAYLGLSFLKGHELQSKPLIFKGCLKSQRFITDSWHAYHLPDAAQ
jgi:hypothetical protein